MRHAAPRHSGRCRIVTGEIAPNHALEISLRELICLRRAHVFSLPIDCPFRPAILTMTPPTPHRPKPALLRKRSTQIAAVAALVAATPLLLMGCAMSSPAAQQQALENRSLTRAQALASMVGMPEAGTHEVRDLQWNDAARSRAVPARLYLPADLKEQKEAISSPAPLVVFSHGIGGSREGYSYIGRYLAANGIAALHVQHVGSDRNLWFGNPLAMVGRLQEAAKETEAIHRAKDVRFTLDQVLQDAELGKKLDARRIAAAGHSYGANTTMLVAGARVQREGQALDFADPRIKAAVIISAPPFYGEGEPSKIVGSIKVPSLHITATGDEIKIPGYYSSAKDRVAVYEAAGPRSAKMLAVFKEGSHSMFTDRLGTGGEQLNPQVKKATRELMLAFLRKEFAGDAQGLASWPQKHAPLVQRFEDRLTAQASL
jgi:dienelactone hydrolase